jgi:hypothetical protein
LCGLLTSIGGKFYLVLLIFAIKMPFQIVINKTGWIMNDDGCYALLHG